MIVSEGCRWTMTTSNNIEVLIAGAGPTGLALACDLARRGVQFRIVDKADAHFIGSKGKGLENS
jgi:2-polyprenyl-6-methoxyphenol hydroxylase-like FAD-dependent oxidoreductase